jgi:quercetin dioxygenase-like cupin family protein
MQLIRHDPSEPPLNTQPIFTGEVRSRGLVAPAQTDQLHVTLVRFAAGGRNVFHRHTFDQVLYIVEGEGIVANKHEEHRVFSGDVVVVPAGEAHWHGATPQTAMAHLAIGRPGETAIVDG